MAKVESLVLKIECDTSFIRDELTKIADEFEQRIKAILGRSQDRSW